MKIGKYEFADKSVCEKKIKSLGVNTDEDGNEYPTHGHTIVKLGHIVLEQGEYDEEGNQTKAPLLSEKYHLDVLWVGIDKHPYGWASAYVQNIEGQGLHSFLGLDYKKFKF